MVLDTVMSLILPVLVSMVITLTMTWIYKSWVQKSGKLPPCPARPYPLLGHTPYLMKNPRDTMKKWREKTGDIFSIYTGQKLTVVISSYDILKETFVKQAEIFSDRPHDVLNTMDEDADRGIVGSSGEVWREHRSVALMILRDFGMGKNILAEKIQEEVSFYLNELGKAKGQPQNVRTLTNVAVSNIICSIIVGKRFDYTDSFLIKLLHNLNEQQVLIKSGTILSAFPWLRYLPGDLFGAKKILKNVNDISENFSNSYIKLFSKTLDQNDGNVNFITRYLKELNDRKVKGIPTTLEVPQLRRVIANLFAAGSETTTTTILWFMVYMLRYPNIQNMVYTEICNAVGTEKMPTVQNRSQLNFLNAVIMETQRLASIVPFGVLHACKTEVNVRGYTIPAGTRIMANIDSVLHDAKLWGDPMAFRPERFLNSAGELLYPEEFIPFSLGKRACLGESLARMELFIFLSALIQRFELQPARSNDLPSLKYIFGLTSPPVPFDIKFVERNYV